MTTSPGLRPTELNPAPPYRYVTECTGARLSVYARGVAIVVRIEGEIDAANAGPLEVEIRRFARLRSPLILDLEGLQFIGLAGFRAVLALADDHHKARMHCTVVSGRALRPLLRLVNGDHGLSVVDSVPEGLQLLDDAIRAVLGPTG